MTATCWRLAPLISFSSSRRIALNIDLGKEIRILHQMLFGRPENLPERRLVPQLKTIGERRKRNLTVEVRKLAQVRWNEDSTLPVDHYLVRSSDIEGLEQLNGGIEGALFVKL